MEYDHINEEYEKWYEVNCKWSDGRYETMDVHAMFLIFRSGWLAKTNAYEIAREKHEQNEYTNQHRRFDD